MRRKALYGITKERVRPMLNNKAPVTSAMITQVALLNVLLGDERPVTPRCMLIAAKTNAPKQMIKPTTTRINARDMASSFPMIPASAG